MAKFHNEFAGKCTKHTHQDKHN